MGESIKTRIARLLSVKSLVTIALTATFVYLSVIGSIAPSDFQTVFLMVITFYFGTKAGEKADEMKAEEKKEESGKEDKHNG